MKLYIHIIIILFQGLGASLLGSILILNDIGLTSNAIKEFSETSWSIFVLIAIVLFSLGIFSYVYYEIKNIKRLKKLAN